MKEAVIAAVNRCATPKKVLHRFSRGLQYRSFPGRIACFRAAQTRNSSSPQLLLDDPRRCEPHVRRRQWPPTIHGNRERQIL